MSIKVKNLNYVSINLKEFFFFYNKYKILNGRCFYEFN